MTLDNDKTIGNYGVSKLLHDTFKYYKEHPELIGCCYGDEKVAEKTTSELPLSFKINLDDVVSPKKYRDIHGSSVSKINSEI